MASQRDVVIVHSSDLHLGIDDSFEPSRSLASLSILEGVLNAAAAARADLVVLAGDTFDNHRQPLELLERVARIMRAYKHSMVILPGNHDPLTPDSVYRRGGLAELSNVQILGLNVDSAVRFGELELEIWGRPHMDYLDMAPLADPRPRSTRWHLAVAHGHYVDMPRDPNRLIGSWLIHREELIATGADYVALGHWNQAVQVGDCEIAAYYSGSPEYAGTVNIVRLRSQGAVQVLQAPINGLRR